MSSRQLSSDGDGFLVPNEQTTRLCQEAKHAYMRSRVLREKEVKRVKQLVKEASLAECRRTVLTRERKREAAELYKRAEMLDCSQLMDMEFLSDFQRLRLDVKNGDCQVIAQRKEDVFDDQSLSTRFLTESTARQWRMATLMKRHDAHMTIVDQMEEERRVLDAQYDEACNTRMEAVAVAKMMTRRRCHAEGENDQLTALAMQLEKSVETGRAHEAATADDLRKMKIAIDKKSADLSGRFAEHCALSSENEGVSEGIRTLLAEDYALDERQTEHPVDIESTDHVTKVILADLLEMEQLVDLMEYNAAEAQRLARIAEQERNDEEVRFVHVAGDEKRARLAREAEYEKRKAEELTRAAEKKEADRLACIAEQERKDEEARIARVAAEKKREEDARLAREAEQTRRKAEELARAAEEKKEADRLACIAEQERNVEEARIARVAADEKRENDARLAREAEETRRKTEELVQAVKEKKEADRLARIAEKERKDEELRLARVAAVEKREKDARLAREVEETRRMTEDLARAAEEKKKESDRLARIVEQERKDEVARIARAAADEKRENDARAEEKKEAARLKLIADEEDAKKQSDILELLSLSPPSPKKARKTTPVKKAAKNRKERAPPKTKSPMNAVRKMATTKKEVGRRMMPKTAMQISSDEEEEPSAPADPRPSHMKKTPIWKEAPTKKKPPVKAPLFKLSGRLAPTPVVPQRKAHLPSAFSSTMHSKSRNDAPKSIVPPSRKLGVLPPPVFPKGPPVSHAAVAFKKMAEQKQRKAKAMADPMSVFDMMEDSE